MPQRAKLEGFMLDAFSDVDDLRRLVRGLEHGQAIYAEIAWSKKLTQVVFELLNALEDRKEIGVHLFAALRKERPRRSDEIAEIEALVAREPLHADWRRSQLERFTGRQVLHRVQDTGIELDRVYVDLDILIQIPGMSVERSDDVGGESVRDTNSHEEIHGSGVYEQAFDLDSWLVDDRPDPTPLILEGEVGTGKTERLMRAVTSLAKHGENSWTTALPLWFDAKTLGKAPLPQILADDSGWSESSCRALLHDTSARFAVFVDSLDEAGMSVNAAIQELRTALRLRLHRLVLAMRPTRRRSFRDVRVARIAPWTPAKATSFLQKYRSFDAGAIARIELGRTTELPDDILATPLMATLSVIVSHDQPGALGNRTRLFRAIIDRMIMGWQRQHARSAGDRGQWQDLAPKLSSLALERLRDHPDGFDEGFLRDRLDTWSDEGSEAQLAALTARYGVLVRIGERYDFALRWFAEYLAGHALGTDAAKIVAASLRSWGFEPARHAISSAVLRAPDEGIRCLKALLCGEERDPMEDRPLHLRRVLLVIAAAADLRDSFPSVMVAPLVAAICRRLFGETSIWIGGEVATAVRALARARGPVWQALEAKISIVLRDPEALCEDPSIDGWQRMLRHRSPEARVFAAEQLSECVDDAEIRGDLFALLADHQWSPTPAFAAAKVLRKATRDAAFMAEFEALHYLLQEAPQIAFGAAALVLRPNEAPLTRLANGLEAAENTGEDVRQAFEELTLMPGGEALSGSIRGDRGAHAGRMRGTRPRVSDSVRWELVRCIAPALDTLPAEWVAEIVQVGDQSHALSHELLNVRIASAPAVVHALVRKYFCDRRMDDLASMVAVCPEIGEVLRTRWMEIAVNGRKEHECVRFPGQALAPLIARGDEAAAAIVAEWMPHSELGQPHWIWDGPTLPAAAFAHPEVLEAARGCLRAADKLHDSLRVKAYQRLSCAWGDEMWDALLKMLEPLPGNGSDRWQRVQRLCAYAELPEVFAQRSVACARTLLGEHKNVDDWHGAALAALRFLDKHRLTAQLYTEIRLLVGLDGGCDCSYLLPLASALVMPALTQAEQQTLSARLAAEFSEDHHLWRSMSAAALETIVRLAPEAWIARLMVPEASLLTLGALVEPSEMNWRLWRALPPQMTGPLALALLRSGKCPTVPWIMLKDPGYRRYARMSDLMWQFVYDGGVEVDEEDDVG